jgi:hypothetical protein
MKILKVLLSAVAVAAAIVGCGSDSGNENASKLAKCASGSSSNTTCSSCLQDKCSAAQKKCYGEDFNGGVCQSYSSCVLNAPDPCMPTGCAQPSGDCQACIMEIGTCFTQNCASICAAGSNNGTGGSGSGTGGSSNGTGASSSGTGASPSGTGATGSTGGGTCTKLNACCGRITQADLKTACVNAYSASSGSESLCSSIYDSLARYCP